MSSPLDKSRQKIVLNWLKRQAKQHRSSLSLSVLTGFLSAICIVIQAALLAFILQNLIIDGGDFSTISIPFIALLAMFIVRAALTYLREQVNFTLGVKVRNRIRSQLLDQIDKQGPTAFSQQTTGGVSTLLIEQVEDLQDFYARYLPQMRLASMIPVLILIAILPFNWAAALILFCTAPLIPFFMILVGMGAADVNRKNFKALAHLSGYFLDRLKGLSTIRLFNQGQSQVEQISDSAENFRIRTMNVLKMAFLSSGVLEFFTSISIAVVAVYFGFSYLGELNFGSYNGTVTLFAGFFALILAPEFFQPLRDLGTFYHAKAQAIAAADNIEKFITDKQDSTPSTDANPMQHFDQTIESICAKDLVILSPNNQALVGPLNFELKAPFQLALIGTSGEGKTSLFNVLLGFLSYQGSLTINGTELKQLDLDSWRAQLSWLGQNPYLINGSIRENILLAKPDADEQALNQVVVQAQLSQLLAELPEGLDSQIGEDALRISIGQAQRIAIARALLKPNQLLLLDEPLASLDKQTASEIEQILSQNIADKNLITITHQASDLSMFNQVWQLKNNQLNMLHNKDA